MDATLTNEITEIVLCEKTGNEDFYWDIDNKEKRCERCNRVLMQAEKNRGFTHCFLCLGKKDIRV